MKRFFGSLSILAVLALLLVSCGPAATPTPQVIKETVPVEVTRPVPQTVPVPAARGVVTVLGVWGGSELANFQEAVFPFTEQWPSKEPATWPRC